MNYPIQIAMEIGASNSLRVERDDFQTFRRNAANSTKTCRKSFASCAFLMAWYST
ncbi:hypothetical protein O9992_23615 [Vibrio lentus]|nr:hypothetical protein [Vibrio lentus]